MDLHRREFLRVAGSGAILALSADPSRAFDVQPRRADALLDPPLPSAEFRGVWVATVANIDWPSRKGLSSDALRSEMKSILDRCVELRLNAVILQVRPSCDTIYPSTLEPWSEFLTGLSGKPPTPEFDPLAEWIDQAHARGIELHAWFNPFRARHHKAERPDAPSHITNTRPDLVRTWGDLKWLDPSEPDAREHSLRVILDVASRYDIDGVHLDDYFYPYPREIKPAPGSAATRAREEFPDGQRWSTYQASGGRLTRSDWRRQHIDGFVRDLYTRCKSVRPSLMFGISPFGIWRPGHPAGVEGLDAYEGMFADARKWLREGWVDYLAPQLYWSTNAPRQPFGPLLDWWRGENIQSRQVWPGLYTSRIGGEGDWKPDEIARQVTESRARPTNGHIHYSMAALSTNRGNVVPVLQSRVYADDAVIPGVAAITPDPSVRVAASASSSTQAGMIRLEWAAPSRAASPAARRWIVQARYGESWRTMAFAPTRTRADIPVSARDGTLTAVAVRRVDALRRLSAPALLTGGALRGVKQPP